MSQNQNDERPQDAETIDETQQLDATPTTDETQVLDATPTDETQVLDATPTEETQVLEAGEGDTDVLTPTPADPDEPLSVFDQPARTAIDTPYGAAAYTAAAYGAAPAPGPAAGTASYPAGGYQTPPPSYTTPPSAYAGPVPHSSYAGPTTTPPSYGGAAYEPMTWTVPPKPLVKTTPRTGTIVWGFIILAIGIGAVSVAAGATIDVTLAMIWLLAAAGAVLVVASILGAARRRSRAESSARA